MGTFGAYYLSDPSSEKQFFSQNMNMVRKKRSQWKAVEQKDGVRDTPPEREHHGLGGGWD